MPDFIIVVLSIALAILGIVDLVIANDHNELTLFIKLRASLLFVVTIGTITWFTIAVNQPYRISGEQVYPIQDVRFANGALQQFYFNGAGQRHDLTSEHSMTYPPGSTVHHQVYAKLYLGILFVGGTDGQDVVVTPYDTAQTSPQK